MLRRFFLTQFPVSLVAVLLLWALLVQTRLWAPYWDTHNVLAVLSWDAMGYYLYLPARFIYHDLGHLGFMPDIMREYAPSSSFYQAFQVPGAPAGQLVMKYSAGLAVLWTPFFWLGHWAAGWLGYPQDGFSAPYQVAIAGGGLCYALLGLGLLRRVLLRYFSDVTTTVALATLVLGSNYFQYAALDQAMTHNQLFTGYALLLWLCAKYYHRPGRGWAFAIGLTLGLLVLIRPSEAIAAVIPLLWKVPNLAAANDRVALLLRRWPDVALLLLGGLLGVLPQGLYWHWATGHWFFYSYGEQQFSWLHPHLRQVLVGFRKGWLVYTPLMLLVLAGFVPLWRRHRGLAVPALAFFLLNVWVVSAWDVWWYGGSFGQRAMVQSYAVLALPWAAAVAWVLAPGRRVLVRAAAAALVLLCVDANLFQNWQYQQGIINAEDMNRGYYLAVLNKTMPTMADYARLDEVPGLPRAERHYQPQFIGSLGFEQEAPTPDNRVTSEQGYYSRQSYHADAGHPYGPAYQVQLGAAGLHPGDYVRGSCRVFSDWGAWGNKLVLSVEHDGKPISWNGVRLQNPSSLNRSWNLVQLVAPIPAQAQPTDVLKVYVLSENSAGCFVDDIAAEKMVEK